MILQALYDYYQRSNNLAPAGYEDKEIPFLIVITPEGNFIRLEDTREPNGKKLLAKKYCVPKSCGRTGKNSFETAFIFWDHFGYVVAHPKFEEEKDIETAQKQNKSFRNNVDKFYNIFPSNNEFTAVHLFYEKQQQQAVREDPLWEECLKIPGCNMAFRVEGYPTLVAEHPDLHSYIQQATTATPEESEAQGVCLVTGQHGPIAILHTGSNLPGGKSGAKLIGLQRGSGYDSYGKEQGANAPVSLAAEAAYTTALNRLLDKSSQNKFALNNTVFLFWADKPDSQFEQSFSAFFKALPKDDPDRQINDIQKLLRSIINGQYSEPDAEARFFILGLAPNVSRIAVRSWNTGSIKEFASNIAQHFHDLRIIPRYAEDREVIPLFNLLTQVAFDYKLEHLSPRLYAAMVAAILHNTPYPALLQQCTLQRIKADRTLSYIRMAILKAYLNRKHSNNNLIKPIEMALDLQNQNPGYLCGRLFAVQERIQDKAADGKLNATIKDRYYTAAATTPVTVFGRLLSLTSHHLSRLDDRIRIYYEKILQSIIAEIPASGFPRHLSLDDQSRFAIGYYHQRCDLFTKKEAMTDTEVTPDNE